MTNLEDPTVANFLDRKAMEIKENPGCVFKRLKEILDELARYSFQFNQALLQAFYEVYRINRAQSSC